MLRQVLLLVISSCLFLQCGSSASKNSQMAYDDPDAYEVYSAILPLEWLWRVAKAKSLVIRSETRGYKMCLIPEEGSEKIFERAISEYVRMNEIPWLLQRNFSIEKPYELVNDDQLKKLYLEQGGWEAFYQQHPDTGGYIELSAVGFNAEKTIAVVYMGHRCEGLCGGGGFHVLQKKEGRWVPIEWKGKWCGWVS